MKKLLNNRFINSSLLIINFVSALVTIYSFWQNFFDKKATIIFLTLCAIGLIFSAAYFVSQKFMSTTDKATELADNFHNVIDTYKDVTLELRYSFDKREAASKYEKSRVAGIHDILIKYNDLLKEAGIRKSRISLKLFRPDCDATLFTYCRDNSVAQNRIQKDHMEKIPVEQCTSFNGIMNRNYEKYFVGNNLIKDYNEKKYFDYRGRPKYSSALVVPIRALRATDKTQEPYYDVIGFLCISSKEKNQFLENEPISLIIIESTRALADCLYTLITETQL